MNVLVIKLGALGDVILALPAMAAIRAHHPGARITILTTPAFAPLLRKSGYADEVLETTRARFFQIRKWWQLARRLRQGKFARVYDLQMNDRTCLFFHVVWPFCKPEWVGIARGCSHPLPMADFHRLHAFDRHVAQLALAGIDKVPQPDMAWLDGDIKAFGVVPPFALLVPGAAPGRPGKRWPASQFGSLAVALAARGIQPVVLGTRHEAASAAEILSACPQAESLVDRTGIADIAALARGAVAAIGNDTGPMHVAAMAGAPSLVLFSGESDPAESAPRGRKVKVLRRVPLSDLAATEVIGALAGLLED
ncbi:MAG TPA: ADP-heptose--LPS heptosyltransferase [Rhodospirillaceae bacterium]|nr:MAG: hypothetical protein A2018_01505 [Alphaproteobacteria bacterium GWF2_58_20]HAU28519.1 ADP-heptose--LPS heptosyltransferase [Rhodospirillaceae bacterium]